MWRVFAELNYKQIGQLFGKSENWACVTYHRARNMIRERLEGSKNKVSLVISSAMCSLSESRRIYKNTSLK